MSKKDTMAELVKPLAQKINQARDGVYWIRKIRKEHPKLEGQVFEEYVRMIKKEEKSRAT